MFDICCVQNVQFEYYFFRYPRNCLLNFTASFLTTCSAKLNEINKKSAQEPKPFKLFLLSN